ncbi:MAG TPA: TonB-dependent receptor plug domain-containing protein [Cyclobacteriaceae bacterium]|mgnify:CR=1 FL=1|nr:TonB-dependent receptor plug domain-containing protein [Cyclobacteriaceae bacterium]HRK54322.1 TonB-dependent receptor plug domain-containing protein [Cyclobacteriaceae bacterium]
MKPILVLYILVMVIVAPGYCQRVNGIERDSLSQWLLPFQEKVYLKTDKGYYYPREDLWFCAIMDYRLPAMRDSLSNTLYVDLIGPDFKIIERKVLRIEGGFSANDFKLSRDLSPGLYFLRAYTNWMRNYGDVSLMSVPIPILSVDKNIKNQEPQEVYNSQTVEVKVALNKETYTTRDRVDVKISLKDTHGKPIKGKCVVTVTDDDAVRSIKGRVMIQDQVGQWDTPYLVAKDTSIYFLERGLTYSGLIEVKHRRFPAHLDIVLSQGLNLVSLDTDNSGRFYLSNLEFYDSLNLFIKAVDQKGRQLSQISIDPPPTLLFVDPGKMINLDLEDFNAAQRIQNTYRPDSDVTLLEEVEIIGKKVNRDDIREDPIKKLYGRPDYTINGEDLISVAGLNVLIGLQGRVPGVRVGENSRGEVQINIRGLSLQGYTTPIIFVDGIPFEVNDLRAISTSQIDHIEIVKRALPQFGSRGANGLIAIYTKMSTFSDHESTIPSDYVLKKLDGYATARSFYSPDYSSQTIAASDYDFRSTLYWNPNVSMDDDGIATLHFYTSDLIGNYTIEVEGVEKTRWTPFWATIKFSVNE